MLFILIRTIDLSTMHFLTYIKLKNKETTTKYYDQIFINYKKKEIRLIFTSRKVTCVNVFNFI